MALALLYVHNIPAARLPQLMCADLNVPICGVVAALVLLFMNLRTPPGTVSEKLRRIDWL